MLTEFELVNVTKNIIQFYASLKIVYGYEDSNQIIFDEGHMCFELRVVDGFFQPELVLLISIEIKNGLLWVHYDATEEFIPLRLEDMGVAKKQIVLGYLTPEQRLETEYAHV